MSSNLSADHSSRILALITEAQRLLNLIDSFSLPTSTSNSTTFPSSSLSTISSFSSAASALSSSKKSRIGGINKFRKRVVAELEFLQEVLSTKVPFKKEYLSCSNLPHYAAVVDRIVLEGAENVQHVMKVFHIVSQGSEEKNENSKRLGLPAKHARMEVDIVCKNGACWIKVKAMSPEGVQAVVDGTATPGHKSVLQIADELLQAAKANPVHYLPPVIVFHFNKGVGHQVARALTKKGLIVEGTLVNVQDTLVDSDSDSDNDSDSVSGEGNDLRETSEIDPAARDIDEAIQFSAFTLNATQDIMERRINLVNLDVTTLITMVSNITNGDIDCEFEDALLTGQLEEEKASPSLAPLLEFLKDKDVFITEMAKEKFLNIVRIVGGPQEQERAQRLFGPDSPYRVVPNAPSARLLDFHAPKVKDQHRVIFGTADAMKATTATANISLLRAAKQRGLPLSTHLHPARALTEQKAIRRKSIFHTSNTN